METISKGIKNKIKHAFTIFHMLVNYLFNFFIMYIPFHFIRLASIKLKVKEMGQKCSFLMGVKILNGNNVYIGNNCVFNRNVTLDGRGGKLRIGNNVDIAQEVNIWTLQHDPHDDFHRSIGNNVIIEDYVWISSRVTILPGVTIGRGAVVASNSVVTKDVPSMSIVAGIPAKIISERKSKLKYTLLHRPWFE